MRIRPLSDMVLVELEAEANVTSGGVHLAPGPRHAFRTGVVLQVGEGRRPKRGGHPVATGLVVGDRVVFSSGTYQTKAGEQLRDSVESIVGQEQVLLRASDVLAVVAPGVVVS